MGSGAPVTISAKATIVATGGLTRLYRRNSASSNMGGDGYALCLRAGAPLIDMEFVQFFPIGHLAPRLIGMDPIMWDPFRYKLGGKLLNNKGEEFTQNYGVAEDGKYIITRDVGTFAILKEVAAGRGSPHGGAYLSFRHVPEAKLREAFGPVIDRLAANGIDLTKQNVEVAPIAHYHMGGVQTDVRMTTEIPGLLVAGEAVGGANGANRLSGNAITEALVFGRQAGRTAVEWVKDIGDVPARAEAAKNTLDLLAMNGPADPPNTAEMLQSLQQTMAEDVGPLRNEASLKRALTRIDELSHATGERPFGNGQAFDMIRLDWLDLRNMLTVARTVTQAALLRTESRGAHQREDFPGMLPEWNVNQVIRLGGEGLDIFRTPASVAKAAAQ
jgi:succinate dehydrogenase / fumarate reductase flavoprotein subunit